MYMLNKKYTALFLGAVLATTLVACSSNDDVVEDTPLDTTQTANDPKEPVGDAKDPSPVPYDYSKLRNGIITVADMPNVSNYTYTLEVEPMEKEQSTTEDAQSEDATTDESALAPHLLVTVDIQNATGAEIQQLQYQSTFDQAWLDMFIGENGQLVHFVDINFDGYADVLTQHQGAEVNQNYYVWLFDLESNQFVATDAYSGMTNLKIDRENQYLLSTNYSQGIPSYGLAQVVDG